MSILLKSNKGSGFSVIIYGISIMLLFIFTAINILNAKVIENGYNSLRDGVLAASSGSVIHLLTSERKSTDGNSLLTGTQQSVIGDSGSLGGNSSISKQQPYDIYLQLALGYIINRSTNQTATSVKSGEINNFIKLDHQKVINSTMSILNNSVIRNKNHNGNPVYINDTSRFKILMMFIEPHYTSNNYEQYFNIIVYGNGDCTQDGVFYDGGKTYLAGSAGTIDEIYKNIQETINTIVGDMGYGHNEHNNPYGTLQNFEININAGNEVSKRELIERMKTMPYYLIVVKDFALPTLFDGVETNSGGNIFKDAFEELSGDGTLSTPMCALNSGKTERKTAGIR